MYCVFLVIVKKNTVSRVATSSKAGTQQMTRRANNNALVMPPVALASSVTGKLASTSGAATLARRGNL